MKSHKLKNSIPTTTPLRSKDPKVLRAELDVFRQKSVSLVEKNPEKAGTILSEWLNKPAPARKKSAA